VRDNPQTARVRAYYESDGFGGAVKPAVARSAIGAS
jgi:hypothetical protein